MLAKIWCKIWLTPYLKLSSAIRLTKNRCMSSKMSPRSRSIRSGRQQRRWPPAYRAASTPSLSWLFDVSSHDRFLEISTDRTKVCEVQIQPKRLPRPLANPFPSEVNWTAYICSDCKRFFIDHWKAKDATEAETRKTSCCAELILITSMLLRLGQIMKRKTRFRTGKKIGPVENTFGTRRKKHWSKTR